MSTYRIREAAQLLGVSDDTVRRWVDAGRLGTSTDGGGRQVIDGAELASFAHERADDPDPDGRLTAISARNRFTGLVTRVVVDKVMAQVEIQSGPHRVVSLMSTEAVHELGLTPGMLAVAVVKSTQVIIETPGGMS